MVGGEYVDVTDLIVERGYQPVYCGEELCKLISPAPKNITEEEAVKLFERIRKLCNDEFDMCGDLSQVKAIENYNYSHTYFITYAPVDVFHFSTKTEVGSVSFDIRRKEDGELILPTEMGGPWGVDIK